MFLSLIIALVIIFSLFIPNRAFLAANIEVTRHEILLAENESVLNANQLELTQDRLQLEKMIRDTKTQH